MDVHSVSIIGVRDRNEDKIITISNMDNNDQTKALINLYCIFDGHGNGSISKILSEFIPKIFMYKEFKPPFGLRFIQNIHSSIQNMLNTKHNAIATEAGSTSLICCMFKYNKSNYIQVINVGDCRCVICRDNIAIPITKDHKPMWPDEKLRIENLGGTITFDGYDYRIGDLSVSRAFGDLSQSKYTSPIPDVFTVRITKYDKFIILACDGLWDVLSNQDVINFILINFYNLKTGKKLDKRINIAKQLAEYAVKKGSTDNISIIIVFLD